MSGNSSRTRTDVVSAIVRGNGTPVVLLHGIGGNAHSYDELAGLLAASYRTIAWDAPGYGESPDPAEPPGIDGYLHALLGLLDGTPAHLVGTSWGGVIATYLAAQHPDAVLSLTLADSTRGSAIDPDKATAMRARPAELADLGPTEFARKRAHRLPAPDASAATLAAVEQQMREVRVPGYRGAAEFMAAADTGELLATITAPTLVLVGEHDRITGVPESELLAERIPGARFELVPDAGHAAVQEQPHVVARLLGDFLAAAGRRTEIDA